MIYYFAYGSNLNLQQMKKICPSAKLWKRAYLRGYRFVYSGRFASIVKKRGGVVWGAVFKIDSNCLKNLDRFEDFPVLYQKKYVTVKAGTDKYKALVYFQKERKLEKTSAQYKKIVERGAVQCGLPKKYINRFILA
jgi:gamma-glutamylcyclotransferase (GGCT)/AIG2-like uncharacterized protein YtfP